jgi:hypothetical protein
MRIVADVAKELASMFLTDVRLTLAILILVAVVAYLIEWLHFGSILGGGLLLVGSLLILVEAAVREARRRRD